MSKNTVRMSGSELAVHLGVSVQAVSKAARSGGRVANFPVCDWAVMTPKGRVSHYVVPLSALDIVSSPEASGHRTDSQLTDMYRHLIRFANDHGSLLPAHLSRELDDILRQLPCSQPSPLTHVEVGDTIVVDGEIATVLSVARPSVALVELPDFEQRSVYAFELYDEESC